jgi:predicted TIM-barrel fold metal-dependent hydrolase
MSEPLRVVDPHVHLWDLWTRIYPHFEKPSPDGSNAAICRSYLLEEYLGEGKDEVEVAGFVHVEAFPTDAVKETETLAKVAERSPVPVAIVSYGDLTSVGFPALLDQHSA